MTTDLEVTYRGRLLILLGVLATLAAWITHGTSVRLASATLLAPLVVDILWGGIRLPNLRLLMNRRRTESGVPFLESFTVHNESTRRVAVDLLLREPRTDTHAGGLLLHYLAPGQRETLRVPARTRSRGRARHRSVVVSSVFPLGLIRRSAVLRCESELVSEPVRMPLPPHVLQSMERDDPDELRREFRGEDVFHSLREYREGDDARTVHAMRSAAAGVLVRRVLRSQPQREACLVLDLRRAPGRSARGGSRRLEWSLGASATIVDVMQEKGAVLTCVVIGTQDRRWTITTPDESEDFLAFLAEARHVEHRSVARESLDGIEGFETCLWVPAGGYKATQDRAALPNPILVTEWEGPV